MGARGLAENQQDAGGDEHHFRKDFEALHGSVLGFEAGGAGLALRLAGKWKG